LLVCWFAGLRHEQGHFGGIFVVFTAMTGQQRISQTENGMPAVFGRLYKAYF